MNYNKQCVVKLFVIDLNSFELKYYPFITRLDKLNESINSVDDLCTIIWLPSKTKDMNVKVFNITRNRIEKKNIGQTYYYKFQFKSHTKMFIIGILAHLFVKMVSI